VDEELKFFCDELAVVERKAASERIFFVSGMEVLSVRMKLQLGVAIEKAGQALSPGWKSRYDEFEKFEDVINEQNN